MCVDGWRCLFDLCGDPLLSADFNIQLPNNLSRIYVHNTHYNLCEQL